jgi:secreted PhoX family phosphatase
MKCALPPAFEDELRECGYDKGRDFIIENRSAARQTGTPREAADDLVPLKVDVILPAAVRRLDAPREGGSEFAGACFSPDGEILFVNIQGLRSPRGPVSVAEPAHVE